MQVDSIPPPPQTKAQVESNLAEAWAVVSRAASLACVDKLQSQYERALPLLDDVAKSIYSLLVAGCPIVYSSQEEVKLICNL